MTIYAGFNYPRSIYQLPKPCNLAGLKKKRELRKVCGPYYSPAPGAIAGGRHPGGFFYLDSDFSIGRGWEWADLVDGAGIDHSGWYTDECGDLDKIRGLVIRLPHGRYLAGWSMGEGMASTYDGEIYTDLVEAARAADGMAETAAEKEREYQERWRRLQDMRDERDDLEKTARAARDAFKEYRGARNDHYYRLKFAAADSLQTLVDWDNENGDELRGGRTAAAI